MKTTLMTRMGAGAIGLAMLAGALPAFADTSTTTSTSTSATTTPQISMCAQTATAVHEDAIASSTAAYSAAVSAALSVRKADLVAAWGQATISARVNALVAAYAKYRKAVETARVNMQAARKTANTTFAASMKACGVTKADVTATTSVKVKSQDKEKHDDREGKEHGKGLGLGLILHGDMGLHLGKGKH
jgi:hypothetical protein